MESSCDGKNMIVTCGSEWSTFSQGKRNFSVGLDAADGEGLLPYFTQLTKGQQREALGVLADLMVLKYMLDEEAIDKSFYDSRTAAIASKMPKAS